MRLSQIAQELQLRCLTAGADAQDADITAGFVSDLLSDVLANAPAGGLLVTVQVHLNVVAVAVHAGLAAVVFAASRQPEQAVIDRARQEQVALYVSDSPAFDVVGRLFVLGVASGQGGTP